MFSTTDTSPCAACDPKALISELKREEEEAEEPAEMEITWDLGLQEKSQQLLESYKGIFTGRRDALRCPIFNHYTDTNLLICICSQKGGSGYDARREIRPRTKAQETAEEEGGEL